MMKRYLFFLFILLLIFFPVTILSQIISGKIVSDDGNPLAGATVLVKGTTIGTSADANGFYSLSVVPGTHELVFSLAKLAAFHVGSVSTNTRA